MIHPYLRGLRIGAHVNTVALLKSICATVISSQNRNPAFSYYLHPQRHGAVKTSTNLKYVQYYTVYFGRCQYYFSK